MIIKFFTPSCAPCKEVGRILEAKEVTHESVDISEDIKTAVQHRVRSVPTLKCLETGDVYSGFKGQKDLEDWLDAHSN